MDYSPFLQSRLNSKYNDNMGDKRQKRVNFYISFLFMVRVNWLNLGTFSNSYIRLGTATMRASHNETRPSEYTFSSHDAGRGVCGISFLSKVGVNWCRCRLMQITRVVSSKKSEISSRENGQQWDKNVSLWLSILLVVMCEIRLWKPDAVIMINLQNPCIISDAATTMDRTKSQTQVGYCLFTFGLWL